MQSVLQWKKQEFLWHSAEVTMIPQTYVELTDAKDIANIQKTLDMLDDDDDVQDVYHNWDE